MYESVNVFGQPLMVCGGDPVTGWYRNGKCDTCAEDAGSHTVCAIMDAEFLAFSKYVGNDLSTPRPEFGFNGLKAGDPWCLCASRWAQAADEGCAPKVVLSATHQRALEVCDFETLKSHAVDI
ncbi:hypothetical protein SAMN06273572_102374 [Monaibacterium marinum]|uniref:DUF2237 domain-containing protein n=1 Tax=Pontivivens marinum TaxID=1690039 RepID=A0A2C9CQQ6_9RHOB|nr:DUF2237 domain-containing protein [Monaibacterium marinum]SOH93696.1 hypothetical protein SAMN06273572_102374 [Monaibacterium marinum]